MSAAESPEDRVARAKGYPFGHPERSYLFRAGRAEPLAEVTRAVGGRTPVIAAGSNAAPAQLARKFAGRGARTAIPVTRARIRDFDSVYNAHIASYGSVPATLFPSAGTALATFVTWLDEAELAVMHGTEQPGVNYHFAELSGLAVEVEGIGVLDTAFAYISVAGCLVHEGGPVSLAAVPAAGRRFPERSQAEILELVRDLTAPGMEIDRFILETVSDEALRRARSGILARTASPFAHAAMRVIPLDGHTPSR